MCKQQLVLLAVALSAVAVSTGHAYQLFGDDSNVANIESKSKLYVDTLQETFRGKQNNALNITFSKQIIVHNIVEIIETLHLACVKTGPPAGGREVCRSKANALVGAGVNVILDVVELFDFLAFNRKKTPEAIAKTALGFAQIKAAFSQ